MLIDNVSQMVAIALWREGNNHSLLRKVLLDYLDRGLQVGVRRDDQAGVKCVLIGVSD